MKKSGKSGGKGIIPLPPGRFFLLTLLFTLLAAAGVRAQNPPVSINAKAITINELFIRIEKQGVYTFAYNNADIDLKRIVTVHAKERPIESIVRECLPEVNVQVSNNKVILTGRRSDQSSMPMHKLTGTVTLTARPDGIDFQLGNAAPARLFDLLPAAYTGAVDEIKRELDELVGLAPVKEYVFGLADNIQVQQRRAAAGFKTASLSMHMIFTGNPGTGKTTIARLVARYLKAIGALKGGQLIEVSRGDLVGRYTGHTAPLTNSVIESALGGVLFIDEAYSLYRGEQDSFGLEAIDTLVKGMEDHRDELVVILAGYTKEMETFLTANSGLASRFPNKIEFPDYTADELLDITNVLARGKGYRLAESCTEPLRGYYERRQAEDARTAGNGRLARNTLEKAIFNQSRRLVAEPAAELDVILPSDLELQ